MSHVEQMNYPSELLRYPLLELNRQFPVEQSLPSQLKEYVQVFLYLWQASHYRRQGFDIEFMQRLTSNFTLTYFMNSWGAIEAENLVAGLVVGALINNRWVGVDTRWFDTGGKITLSAEDMNFALSQGGIFEADPKTYNQKIRVLLEHQQIELPTPDIALPTMRLALGMQQFHKSELLQSRMNSKLMEIQQVKNEFRQQQSLN